MTLGVLGTMVWDRIEHPDGDTVERWGGIAYSLAAATAATPGGWTIRPIIKLGSDLAASARAFMGSLPGLDGGGVLEVDEPNNRVHLRYGDRHHRTEQLTGGVPGWTWAELEPRLQGLDGLYVNMISGFELNHELAAVVGARFEGPRYVDLHSLVLDVGQHGHRVPRPLEHREAWLGAFHVIQINERELTLVVGEDDPGEVIGAAVRTGARAVLVTRGPEGAAWFAPSTAAIWPEPDTDGGGAVRSGTVALEGPRAVGDPTGCGDVWGATCFVRLMQGARLETAMAAANRAAARNVDHRGADGLHQHLRTDH